MQSLTLFVVASLGDVRKPDRQFEPEPNGHAYASELLDQVVSLNKGIYLDDEIDNAMPSDFCIGIAGYPEKHETAPNMESDMRYLKKKVEGGADYIVTQMFFDNQKYFDFVKICRDNDINIPIIPGIKPVTTKRQITLLPQLFNIDLPEALTKELENCKDNDQARQIGELMAFGVPSLHYYSMGKSTSVYEVAKEVF